jgi:hypothetical protein
MDERIELLVNAEHGFTSNGVPKVPKSGYFSDERPQEPEQQAEPGYQFIPGGSFILDTDPEPKALWGEGDHVLWADGEALMLPGPQGAGKTTLVQATTPIISPRNGVGHDPHADPHAPFQP